MSEPGTSVSAPTSALGKGLLVLEALPHANRLSDIAAKTGLPVSTVHRVLRDLTHRGWAYQDGDHNYSAGGRLLHLGRTVLEIGDYHKLADPILRRLVDETGHTMHFGIVQGSRAVYVSKIDGHGAYRMRSRVGLTIPLHSTAIGKAVLAALPTPQRRRLVHSLDLARFTGRTLTNPDTLLAHLQECRTRGWTMDDRENEPTTRCIGAVVHDPAGQPIGGVSMSSLTFDLPIHAVHRWAPRVQEVAAELTATLGGQSVATPSA